MCAGDGGRFLCIGFWRHSASPVWSRKNRYVSILKRGGGLSCCSALLCSRRSRASSPRSCTTRSESANEITHLEAVSECLLHGKCENTDGANALQEHRLGNQQINKYVGRQRERACGSSRNDCRGERSGRAWLAQHGVHLRTGKELSLFSKMEPSVGLP